MRYYNLDTFYTEIKKLCRKDCYTLILHKHLGDIFYAIAAKNEFKKIYGEYIYFIIPKKYEFIMKLFGIIDYDIYNINDLVKDNTKFRDEYYSSSYTNNIKLDELENITSMSLFSNIPVKGEPFVCENLLNNFFSYDDYFCYRWCENMGLGSNFYFPLPRTPENFSRQVEKKLSSIAPLNKIVLFAPEAATAIEIPPEFWNSITDRIHAEGYTVIVNSQKYRLNHGISAFDLGLSLEDVVALGFSCDSVFSLRSGLCDVLVNAGQRLYAFYPSMLRREMGSLTEPFAAPTGVHEILLHNWEVCGSVVWHGHDFTPLLQKQVNHMRRQYQMETCKAFFSIRRSRKKGHKFWKNIFNNVAGYAKWFPDNNKKYPQSKNKKITFGPFIVYERTYFPDRVKISLLGGMLHEVRHQNRTKRLHLFGLCVYSLKFTLFRTTKILGVTIQKKPWRERLLEDFTRQLNPARKKVYLLPYHIGEAYVFLVHAQKWLKGKHRDIQVVVWKKSMLPLYRMFLHEDIPLTSVSLDHGQLTALFGPEPVETGGFTIFSADAHILDTLLAKLQVAGSSHFYTHIKGLLQAENTLVKPPRLAPNIKKTVDDVLSDLAMKERFVVLLPEASTSSPVDEKFWQGLCRALQSKGYDVFVNSQAFMPDGAKTYKLPIDAFYELASRSAGIVALASGMTVLLSAAGKNMDILYTDYKNSSHDAPSSTVLKLYSLRGIEGVSPELVREWDTSAFSLDIIRENILARY